MSSRPRLGSFHAAREHGDQRESGTIKSAHPFHRLRTNILYCLSWFVSTYTCMCLLVTRLCSMTVIFNSKMSNRSTKFNVSNCLDESQYDSLTLWANADQVCWAGFWPECVHTCRPLQKDSLWKPSTAPRTQNTIFYCCPITFNLLTRQYRGNITQHIFEPISPCAFTGCLMKNKQRPRLHERQVWQLLRCFWISV